MPVAENNRVVPKSALRHRSVIPEMEELSIPAWTIPTPRASRPTRTKRKIQEESKPGLATKKSGLPTKKRELPPLKRRQPLHWTVPVGLTIMGMLFLTLAVQLTWNWGTSIYNNLRYGMPRTMQVDAFVGQEAGTTPSHFIAENIRGRVVIIEMPGGDVQHVRVIVGPQIMGPNADQVPVVISFVDRNRDHRPDMLVRFGAMEVWYTNENGTFVPQ
jgi:hypothetical protein